MIEKTSSSARPGKVAVLVLGMHRSGTSSLAGLLDRLGCKGPATPMPADQSNAKGYFESLPIFRLNDAILKAAGSQWNDWRPLHPDWHLSPRFGEFRDKAQLILKEEFNDASLIYLKDPRICLLLPFWQEVLLKMGYRSVFLNTYRNPLDVAASLKKRNNMDPGLSLLVWLRHVLEAERQSRGKIRFFTSYENVLQNPGAVASAMESSFGFPWPVCSSAGLDLVDNSLRHHRSDLKAVFDNDQISPLVQDTLSVLEDWVAHGEKSSDHDGLDAISKEFEQAGLLFSDALRALEADAAQLAPALAREAEAAATLKRLTQEKTALETKLAEDARQAQEDLHQQAAAADRRVADAEAKLDAAKARQDSLSRELDILTDRLIDREKVLAGMRRDTLAAFKRAERLEEKNRQLQDVQQNQADEILSLKQRVENVRLEYLSSTSWRISTPVRVAGGLIKRMRGRPC